MILNAGLSPAWQQVYEFERLETGRVNRAVRAFSCASGKVLNVARALTQLHADAQTICLVGGTTGRLIQEELASESVPVQWIHSKSPTRVCTTLLETGLQQTTELVENCGPVEQTELEAFERSFAQLVPSARFVVLIGSLPTAAPSDFYSRLLSYCAAAVPALLDARGAELLAALPHRPLLVKPNREELEKTVGRPLPEFKHVLHAARELNERGAEWVLVTDGPAPALLVSRTEAFRLQPLPATVVNPIGCGDCLAAATAAALCENRSVLDAVRFGMAAAADNLQQAAPAALNRQHVETRWREVRWEQI